MNRLRNIWSTCEQFVFMKGKSTEDAIFALRYLQGRCRKREQDLHCVLINQDWNVPREELLWVNGDMEYQKSTSEWWRACTISANVHVVRCAAGSLRIRFHFFLFCDQTDGKIGKRHLGSWCPRFMSCRGVGVELKQMREAVCCRITHSCS